MLNVIFLFSNPKRHILARNRILREIFSCALAVERWKNPEKKEKAQ